MLTCDKDSLNNIFQKLDLLSQLRLRATCRELRMKLDITDLYNIDSDLRMRLNDRIVLQYPKLELLNTCWTGITDESVKELKQLRKLNANKSHNVNSRTITDTSVKELKQLQSLDAGNNPWISDISVKELKQLQSLNAYNNPSITDESVKELKQLRELFVFGNPKITKEGTAHIKKVYL